MGSRQKTGGAVARPPEPSKHTTAISASAMQNFRTKAFDAGKDSTVAACEKWLALQAERTRLSLAWSRGDEWLLAKCGKLDISADRQSNLPEARKLREIAARLKSLHSASDLLLESLPTARATTAEAVAANLSVAAALIYSDDHPEAHGLMVRAVRDLKMLGRNIC